MTLSDFFGEQGIDWKEAVQEIAAERDFAASLGVTIGVEQAQPQPVEPPIVVEPEVVMPAAEFSQLIAKLDCGTGAGGFKPGNDCARGGASGKKKESEKPKTRNFPSKFQNISDFEEKIVEQDFESCMAVDENGDVLLEKDGEKSQIELTLEEKFKILRSKNPTFTHNHPQGAAFSDQDFKAAADINLYEIRAITKDSLYVLRRPSGSDMWPASGQEIKFEHEQQAVDLAPKYAAAIENGDMTPEKANVEWQHETCKNTAAVFGLYYERF